MNLQEKRYLIGPDYYDSYLSVLKIVITIFVIIGSISAFLDVIFALPIEDGFFQILFELFLAIFVSILQGIAQGFLWVTLIFIIVEKKGIRGSSLPFSKKNSTINRLPEHNKKRSISRVEVILGMFFTTFFTALIYLKPQIIAWYTINDGKVTLKESLFVLDQFQSYLSIIVFLAIFQLIILIYKFITRNWNLPLAIANTAYNTSLSVLVAVMVTDDSLFNQDFITQFAQLTKTPFSQITSTWLWSLWAFALVFIVISFWDSVNGFIKSRK